METLCKKTCKRFCVHLEFNSLNIHWSVKYSGKKGANDNEINLYTQNVFTQVLVLQRQVNLQRQKLTRIKDSVRTAQ
jgi:hypothetical protein